MQAHTRKRHTENEKVEFSDFDEEGSVPAEVVLDKISKGRPISAVCLRGCRYREDMTQKELAEKLGITQGNLSAMENGKRPIGKEMAKRLAKILNTNYKHFL
jgi:DNA-binding XRE family transcriptional regulator